LASGYVLSGKNCTCLKDIEKRTGLLRCYISRVEHGHTVPSIETLEKMARALEVHTCTNSFTTVTSRLYCQRTDHGVIANGAHPDGQPAISRSYVTPSPECGLRIAVYCCT
jgi:transcriptional regulator with XRE-family HTH domain